MSAKRQILVESIIRDAQYVGRVISSARSRTASDLMPMIVFSMGNFMSLFVFEARRQTSHLGPVFDEVVLSADFEIAVKQSRHVLKLFEDTRRDIPEQIRFFEEDLVKAHKDRFLGKTWCPAARFLEKDLGVCSYGDQDVTSTHVANLALGLDPAAMFSDGSERKRHAVAVEYGRFFATRGAILDEASCSFVNLLSPSQMRWRDVKSWKVYPAGFNGQSSLGLNAWLRAFQMWLNFTNGLLSLDRQDASVYTTCKLQYLTLYSVVRSLDALLVSSPVALTDESRQAVRAVLDDPDSVLFASDPGRKLRNVLMHYRPDEALAEEVLMLDDPLYGLTMHYFDGMTVGEFRGKLDAWGERVRVTFDGWSKG